MKKNHFLIILIVSLFSCQKELSFDDVNPPVDEKLYGTTPEGGQNGFGVLFSFDPYTSTYTKLMDFNATSGNPSGKLVRASDGKLYGTTLNGGGSGYGLIFSFNPSTSTYSKLLEFDGKNGIYPYGTLIQATNGKLYGTTFYGGASYPGPGGAGVIFSFDPYTYTYIKLLEFDDVNGQDTYCGLTQAKNGKLYGMTMYGINNACGVIFSFDPSTSLSAKLMDLDWAIGCQPWGGLMQAKDKKLYGMAGGGVGSGDGVIFSFDPSTFTYTKLVDFDITNGHLPYGNFIQASDGKLYGMTAGGGSSDAGVIFSFDPSTFTYTKLVDFDIINGANSYGSLFQGSNAKLYGMTYGGGSNGLGVIFSYDPSTFTYSKLMDFDGNDGAHPHISAGFIK